MEEQQDEGSEASASQDPSRNEYASREGPIPDPSSWSLPPETFETTPTSALENVNLYQWGTSSTTGSISTITEPDSQKPEKGHGASTSQYSQKEGSPISDDLITDMFLLSRPIQDLIWSPPPFSSPSGPAQQGCSSGSISLEPDLGFPSSSLVPEQIQSTPLSSSGVHHTGSGESSILEDIRPGLSPLIQPGQLPQPALTFTDNMEINQVNQPVPSSSSPIILSKEPQPESPALDSLLAVQPTGSSPTQPVATYESSLAWLFNESDPGEPSFSSSASQQTTLHSEAMRQTESTDRFQRALSFPPSNRNRFIFNQLSPLVAGNTLLKDYLSVLLWTPDDEQPESKRRRQEDPQPREGSSDRHSI